jgi:hypothetical protein
MQLSRALLAVILTAACMFAVFAQDEGPKPDRWRGLVIDQSTPEDAIKLLGKPKKDKLEGVRTYPLNKRLTLDHNSKDVRRLSYEKLEGMKQADLYFKDGKLVLVEIQPEKKIEASAIARIYGITFTPKVSAAEFGFSTETHKGNSYPVDYPPNYYLIGLSDKTYVSAQVTTGVGGIMFGSRRGKIGEGDDAGFPGQIIRIQIISRTVENHEGEDVLR